MVLQFFIKCRIRLKYYWLDGCHSHNPHEWVIKFNGLPRLADTGVHAVHISHALCNISKSRVNLNWSCSQFGPKSVISSPVWLWNLMEDLNKQYDTFSTLHQALCIISYVSVNYNWSYSPETPNLGQNRCFLSRVTSKFDRWHWKRIGPLFYTTSSFVHHFVGLRQRWQWVNLYIWITSRVGFDFKELAWADGCSR